MTSRNQVGAKQCRDCVHYANSEVLLCAPNPTRLKTEDCEYYELEKPITGLAEYYKSPKTRYWDGAV
jgi:hypothetical protein